MKSAGPRLKTLVSASASGYYGPRGDEQRRPSPTPPGDDFLADVVVRWEREATAAEELGVRVAMMRTGIVLSEEGGALGRMLTPFKLGVGGPIAGGGQYMPWIHADDVVGAYLFALDNDDAQRADQPVRARAGDQQGVLQGARQDAAPPGVRAGARRSRSRPSTARWRRSS